MWEREGGGYSASSQAAGGQTLHPPESDKGVVLSRGDKRRKDSGQALKRCWGCSVLCASISNPVSSHFACCCVAGRVAGSWKK